MTTAREGYGRDQIPKLSTYEATGERFRVVATFLGRREEERRRRDEPDSAEHGGTGLGGTYPARRRSSAAHKDCCKKCESGEKYGPYL
jgi:hypothetical protein